MFQTRWPTQEEIKTHAERLVKRQARREENEGTARNLRQILQRRHNAEQRRIEDLIMILEDENDN